MYKQPASQPAESCSDVLDMISYLFFFCFCFYGLSSSPCMPEGDARSRCVALLYSSRRPFQTRNIMNLRWCADDGLPLCALYVRSCSSYQMRPHSQAISRHWQKINTVRAHFYTQLAAAITIIIPFNHLELHHLIILRFAFCVD